MSFKPPFPPAAVEYIRINQDESRSVLAFKVTRLFGYQCTKEGVKGVIKKLKREPIQSASSSPAGIAGH